MSGQVRMSSVALLSCAMCLSLPATTWAAACDVTKRCTAGGIQGPGGPEPGDPFNFEVSGPGLATVDFGTGELLWTGVLLNGSSPQFGDMAIELNLDEPSTGVLEACPAPTAADCLENTNSMFFHINTLFSGLLTSDTPIILQALVTELPPKAVYDMIGAPVDFYDVDDPTKEVVFTIQTASVAVVPDPPPIPTVSEWSVVVMVLVLLVTGTIVFAGIRRRRSAAA